MATINEIEKILQAMKKSENISVLQRFANAQSILPSYGHRNIMLLLTQAKKANIEIKDIRPINEWSSMNVGIIETKAKPLAVYKRINTNGEISTIRELAYDISDTTASYEAITAREPKIIADDYEYLYDALKEHFSQAFNIQINDTSTINKYYYHSKALSINKDHDIIAKTNFLIKSIMNETIYGDKIRSFELLEQQSNHANAINKLTANAIFHRFGIKEPNLIDFNESQELFFSLEQSCIDIGVNLRTFLQKSQLGNFISNSYETNKEIYEAQKELDNKIKTLRSNPNASRKKPVEFVKIDDTEYKILTERTHDEIVATDPLPVIDALGLTVSKNQQGKITFKARAERTASAQFGLVGGAWLYNDLGDASHKGTVINLVKNIMSLEHKEAIEFCCDKLGVPNYYQIRKEEVDFENEQRKKEAGWDTSSTIAKPTKSANQLLEERKDALEELKRANEELEKITSVNSKVISASKDIPQKYIDFLKNRGITNTQINNFYFIKGETWKYNEAGSMIDVKQKEGVGVLCANKEQLQEIHHQINTNGDILFNEPYDSELITIGADVHFPPYTFKNDKGEEVTMKTQSFGLKKNSTLMQNQGERNCVIESKMDYAAAAQQINFKENNIDIDIANSTSNADIVAKNLVEGNYKKTLFLNQFDIAGVKFLIDIHKHAHNQGLTLQKFDYVTYSDNEYKQDINDIIKNGHSIKNRVKEGNLYSLQEQINAFRRVEKESDKLKEVEKLQEYLNDTIKTLNLTPPQEEKTPTFSPQKMR